MQEFTVGDRVSQNGKIAVVRKYGGHTCVIQYLSHPLGFHTVLTKTLSKEKKMPRMEFMNGAQQGVGFIQVGNDLIPAKGELTVSSTGEPSLNISMDYSCGQIEFGFEISHSLNPKQIIFNGSTTTCVFEDDTKYHSRPTIDDDFDPEVGVAMCIMKKLYGSRSKFQEAVAKGYFQEPKKVKPKKAKAKGK